MMMPLVAVTYPAQLNYFYQLCSSLAEIDPLPSESVLESIFDFRDDAPFSSHFTQFGMTSSSFIQNTGSLPLFVAMVVGGYFLWGAARRVAIRRYQSRAMRRLGMYAEDKISMALPMVMLFVEAYMDLGMGACVHINALLTARDHEDLMGWFNTPSDAFSTGLAIIVFAACILVPPFVMIKLYRNFEQLRDPEIKAKYGVFYEDLKYGDMVCA
jgi:hypothetical protein